MGFTVCVLHVFKNCLEAFAVLGHDGDVSLELGVVSVNRIRIRGSAAVWGTIKK